MALTCIAGMGRWSMVIAPACAVALGAAGGGLGAGAADEETVPPPKTLVVAHGPIAAFAQDGSYIAWASADEPPGCVWRVRVRSLATQRQYRVNRSGGPTCQSATGFDLAHPSYLALARTRALWTLFEQGNNTYTRLITGRVGAKRETALEELVYANSSFQEGWHLGGLAGDGKTLVYGKARVGVRGPPDCDIQGTCSTVIDAGGVQRVVGRSARAVAGALPPMAVSSSGGRVASVIARHGGPSIGTGTQPGIEIRYATTGALVRRFAVARAPLTIALSRTRVVILVRTPGARRLLRYSVAGALLDGRSIPSAGGSVSVNGARVVFAVGRSIKLWDESGAVTVLALAAARPIGLSIEGNRVAWAENVTIDGSLRGRIRALTL